MDRDAEHRAVAIAHHVGIAPPPAATDTTGNSPNATTNGATDHTERFSPAS